MSAAVGAETFDSTDLDQIEAFVSTIWSKMGIGAVGEHTRAQISRRFFGAEVEFDDADYSFDIAYDAEPPDQLIICDVVSRTIRRGDDGAAPEDVFGPGDQFLISRPGLPYRGVAHGTRLRFTQIDPAALAHVAASAEDADPGPPRLLDHRPVSRAAQVRLQQAITHVRASLQADQAVAPTPLLVSTATQYLAATVLHTYPNTAVGGLEARDRRDAHPSTVARAVAFLEANADLELTLADVAAAACVTPRALQLAFRRHLDTTPTAYLRRVRLAHAHDELRRLTAQDTSVGAVAARWGFTPSRFSRQYRTTYGELPHQTLRG